MKINFGAAYATSSGLLFFLLSLWLNSRNSADEEWLQSSLASVREINQAAMNYGGSASIVEQSVDKGRRRMDLDLILNNTRIGDAEVVAIVKLGGFQFVKLIDLRGSSVTDESFAVLVTNRAITTFILSGTKITDKGLQCLGKLAYIERLYLNDTNISDRGLDFLHSRAPDDNFRLLEVKGTRVTKDEGNRLKELHQMLNVQY